MWAPKFRDTWINIFDSKDEYRIIHDCLVDFETGLVIKDNEIQWDLANENIIWFPDWITANPKWMKRIPRQELILERMLSIESYIKNKMFNTPIVNNPIEHGLTLHLLHPFNRYVYGHFYDVMQKLEVIERNALNIDSVLLTRGIEITDFDTHLSILIDSKIHKFSDPSMGLIRVKNLLFVMPPTHPTTFLEAGFDFIQDKYFKHFGVSRHDMTTSKLFLTRRAGQTKRYLKNSNEVESGLEEIGVRVLDGTEDIETIVTLFSSASHVAGVHGALFMNNIFSNLSTRFYEFCPKLRDTRTFHDQFKRAGEYRFELIDCDDDFNVEIPMEKLLNFYKT